MKFIVRDWSEMCVLYPELNTLTGRSINKENYIKFFGIISSRKEIAKNFVQILPNDSAKEGRSDGDINCFLFKVEE